MLLSHVLLFQINTLEIFRLPSFRPRGWICCLFVVAFWKRRKVKSCVRFGAVRISGTAPYSFVFPGFIRCFVLSELVEVLDKLAQGQFVSKLPAAQTTDANDTSQFQRRVSSKRTFKRKKSYATDEIACLFVTRLTNATKNSVTFTARYVCADAW